MNLIEWLTAVSEHPQTVEDDFIVATSIATGRAHQPGDVDELDTDTAAGSFEWLEQLGFLTSVLSTDHELGTEHLLELTLP